jgi:O-antigen/teichoic acid export membrane protein
MAANLPTRPPTTDDTGGVGGVVRSFGPLAVSNLVSQLVGFVVLIYVARRTGATNLGAFAFAFLLATYFNLFATLGIDYLAMRDVAQGRDSAGSIVGETLVLQSVLSVILYIGLVALAPQLATNHHVALRCGDWLARWPMLRSSLCSSLGAGMAFFTMRG